MTFWIILSAYVVGWYVAAPAVVRMVPERQARADGCHVWTSIGASRDLCKYAHGPDCWGPFDRPPSYRVPAGMALALVWPLLLVGWDVYRRSQGKPSRHDLTANIARLERELEIGGDQ